MDDLIRILSKNSKNDIYKSDKRIRNAVIRVLNELVCRGKMGKCDLESLSNFELLKQLENGIISGIDRDMVKMIEGIDYVGKCWYTPKELSVLLFEDTGVRHNFRKIKKILDGMEREGKLLKMGKYRMMYN